MDTRSAARGPRSFDGLEGDADANNDNQITAGELHSFVTDKVERQSGFKQTPDLQGDAERVIVRFE